MRIQKMKLENFQGIRELELDFNSRNVSIYGDNATGKTTIANAWSWLLFGKAATDIKSFSPKTKDDNGDIHHLINSVEVEIIQNDGSLLTLRKEHKEKWVKKRGSEVADMTGEGDEFFIDGVPKKQKEYDTFVKTITADSDIVRMLTSVEYFPETMKWDARRQILLDIAGDISDDEIIEHTYQLKPLKEKLLKPGTTDQYYSVSEMLKMKKAELIKINKELDNIPGRINEAKKAIPDVAELSETKLKEERENINVYIQRLNTEISDLQSTSAEHDYQVRLKDLERQNSNCELDFKQNKNKELEPISERIRNLSDQLTELHNVIISSEKTIKASKDDLEYMRTTASTLQKQIKELSESYFDENAQICPTCNQPLPINQVEQLREKFNLDKSKKLEEMKKRGKENYSKEHFQEIKDLIEVKTSVKEKAILDIESIKKEVTSLLVKKETIQKQKYEETSEYAQYLESKARLTAEFNKSSNSSLEVQIQGRQEKIRQYNVRLDEISTDLSKITLAETQNKRVAELTQQQKEYSRQYSEGSQLVHLCEMFIQTKTTMVTATVNEKFKTIQFRLFDTQMNGGIKECCDVMIPSPAGAMVPYAIANNAAKINAGLEIIDTLSKHYNLNLPVFIDNAESVSKLNKIENQMIRLVVSEKDKKLRLEREEQ